MSCVVVMTCFDVVRDFSSVLNTSERLIYFQKINFLGVFFLIKRDILNMREFHVMLVYLDLFFYRFYILDFKFRNIE